MNVRALSLPGTALLLLPIVSVCVASVQVAGPEVVPFRLAGQVHTTKSCSLRGHWIDHDRRTEQVLVADIENFIIITKVR
ncbi:MAG: hypothetical protein ABSH08_08615 [Tepidisphaeraceae bacterium]